MLLKAWNRGSRRFPPKFEHEDRSELWRTAPWKTAEEENMASHKELRELMLICLHTTTITSNS